MKKIKIKKAPRTGDQQDYSLVYNDTVPSTSTSIQKPQTSNIMKETNNGNESVEVEHGETVVGDINYDGLLELMSFSGKRHSQGGINVHIPEGSFIFSDTPKLKIKDEEILKIFNMGKRKSGYTPAEISKKYQINEYVNTLKDDKVDDITKRTAHQMLKNNTEKLAILAVIQEQSKGMPTGIPEFAQQVLSQKPEMQDGGSFMDKTNKLLIGKYNNKVPNDWYKLRQPINTNTPDITRPSDPGPANPDAPYYYNETYHEGNGPFKSGLQTTTNPNYIHKTWDDIFNQIPSMKSKVVEPVKEDTVVDPVVTTYSTPKANISTKVQKYSNTNW